MPDSGNDHTREKCAHERDNKSEQHSLRPGGRTSPMVGMARGLTPEQGCRDGYADRLAQAPLARPTVLTVERSVPIN